MPLTMNVTVNVNNARAGEEGSIEREVRRAMQDPVCQLLDQIKAWAGL